MAHFLDQAKEVLTTEQVRRLEDLAKKAADFESNQEEDTELFNLKKEVKKLVANRDREKNLSFLKEGGYTIAELLKAVGATKDDITKAVKELFPAEAKSNEPLVIATYGTEDFNINARVPTALAKTIKTGKEKTLIKNLTEKGREWILDDREVKKGKYKGTFVYPNINKLNQKFGFDKETLKKELGLTKPAEKKAA